MTEQSATGDNLLPKEEICDKSDITETPNTPLQEEKPQEDSNTSTHSEAPAPPESTSPSQHSAPSETNRSEDIQTNPDISEHTTAIPSTNDHIRTTEPPAPSTHSTTENTQKNIGKELGSGEYPFYSTSSDPEGVTNLFVNYLPPRAGDDVLHALFSPYGEVESCKVMLDLQTGQSRCFGFVKYKNPESAKQAISVLNGYNIDNKSLVVKPANTSSDNSPKGAPSNNLYIKGIPTSVKEDYLSQLFSPYGSVAEVKILSNPVTGQSRGVGFVRYNSPSEAAHAIKALNGVPITGSQKPLVVKYADAPGGSGGGSTRGPGSQNRGGRQRNKAPSRYTPYAPVQAPPMYTNPMYGAPGAPPVAMMPPYPMMPPHPGVPYMPDNSQLERNLFVYHLPQNADDMLLYRLFSPIGAIESAKAVTDPSGLCKGFGFVKMINHPDAVRAIQLMNGAQVGNKYLKVSFKK